MWLTPDYHFEGGLLNRIVSGLRKICNWRCEIEVSAQLSGSNRCTIRYPMVGSLSTNQEEGHHHGHVRHLHFRPADPVPQVRGRDPVGQTEAFDCTLDDYRIGDEWTTRHARRSPRATTWRSTAARLWAWSASSGMHMMRRIIRARGLP